MVDPRSMIGLLEALFDHKLLSERLDVVVTIVIDADVIAKAKDLYLLVTSLQ